MGGSCEGAVWTEGILLSVMFFPAPVEARVLMSESRLGLKSVLPFV